MTASPKVDFQVFDNASAVCMRLSGREDNKTCPTPPQYCPEAWAFNTIAGSGPAGPAVTRGVPDVDIDLS